jgi:hypothetical protein
MLRQGDPPIFVIPYAAKGLNGVDGGGALKVNLTPEQLQSIVNQDKMKRKQMQERQKPLIDEKGKPVEFRPVGKDGKPVKDKSGNEIVLVAQPVRDDAGELMLKPDKQPLMFMPQRPNIPDEALPKVSWKKMFYLFLGLGEGRGRGVSS